MANLFLTKTCNRRCQFCFAKTGPWSDNYQPRPLNIEEIQEFIKLPMIENRPECGIVGGEPLLHPDLPEIIKLLNSHHVIPKIFTSGTCPIPNGLSELNESNFYFVVNSHPRETYSQEEWHHLNAFFQTFHAKVKLGYTILNPQYDPSFLLDYYQQFSLQPFLRVGIALPIATGENEFVSKEMYRDVAIRFLDLAQKAFDCGMLVGMDCGFVACMFTTAELGLLQKYGVKLDFSCKPVIDIGPDLEAWFCFPLSKMKRISIREERSVVNVYKAFQEKADRIRDHVSKGIYERCQECRYFSRGQCSGGCLGLILYEQGVECENISDF